MGVVTKRRDMWAGRSRYLSLSLAVFGGEVGGGEDLGGLVVVVDPDAAAQHVEITHPPQALGRVDAPARLGEEGGGLDIGVVLVDQAALEPATLAGDLARRQREVLVLGHLDRHGGELGE